MSTEEINTPEMEQKKQTFLTNIRVTSEQVAHVMNIPQRTDDWKKWRSGRMTASNYGSAADHNPHCNPKKLLMNLLWDDFKGNFATDYGSKHESDAAKVYEDFMKLYVQSLNEKNGTKTRISFFYPGLIICEKQPWLAVSPDGLPCLHYDFKTNVRFLLEIKCPVKKNFYPHIPHYYYDQIVGLMSILQLPFCDFVVWTPEKTQIRRFNANPDYWKKVLFPRLHNFYMNEYLPRLIMKEEGLLKHKELEPTLHLDTTSNAPLMTDTFDFILDEPVTQKESKKKKVK